MVNRIEDFIIENWSDKLTLRKGHFSGDPNNENAYGVEVDLLFDYDSREFYRKVNGLWQVAFQNDTLSISGSTTSNPQDEVLFSQVNILSFDYETGILVEEINPQEVKVKLGSHFKTITVDDQEDVVAFGQDTLNLSSGSLINVITDPDTKSISFDLIVEDISIDYNQITNKPDFSSVATSGSYSDLIDKPNFSSVAVSGSYSDLIDKPDLFSGSYSDLIDKPDLFSGSYSDLVDKPDFSSVAVSGSYSDLIDKPNFSSVAVSGSYSDLIDKPDLFSGSYSDLIDKPDFSAISTSGSYSDLVDKPDLFSGSYSDLVDKPDLSSLDGGSTIFLVDVQPLESGKQVSITWDQEDSYNVARFSTTTNQVRLEVEIEGGERYRGNYTANGIPFLSYQQLSPSRRFLGTVDLDLQGESEIYIEGNGGSLTIPFVKESVISITKVSFDKGSYPSNQTELKAGDVISLQIEADKTFDLVRIQDDSSNALKPVDKAVFPPSSSTTLTFEVADRGSSLQQLETRLRVRGSETGSLSSWRSSDNNVRVNNLYPSIFWGSIDYPNSQTALKDSEQAIVNYTVTDTNSFSITSNELNIVSEGSTQATVELNSLGQSQGYRDSGTNLNLTAQRNANGSSSTEVQLVEIAHIPPSTSNPNPKFRTDNNPQINDVSISFNQNISSLSVEGSIPEGNFMGISGNNNNWSIDIELSNNNSHGVNPYSFSVQSINKAGIITSHSLSYRIQGFYPITQTIDTNTTLTTSLSVSIVNPDNLVITSPSPPITFYLVESFSDSPDGHKQFKVSSGSIEFNSPIQNFLTGNDPPGQLTVDIEEL